MSQLVTVTAHLTHGIPIAGKRAKTVVIREPLLEDMIAAETEATQFSPLAFRRALVARQIVSIDGDTDTPVTPKMLGQLRPGDWQRLVNGLNEAEQLGEAAAGAESPT
ncbi:phage tail assembly protein [Gulbenkiania mobilis]|uniref:phage tail assembly protein n=1 Tax=Gulbenkiania mobilis TaxID=397457 RepID=UPI0006BBE81E|nr:phage tail assembly protein [Gulbenkiania mobilis]